jgi:hypothetical protein
MNDDFEQDDFVSDPAQYGRADELASAWFDDRAAIEPEGEISDGERSRLADLAFLNALLERLHVRGERTREERIRRVMEAIDAECPEPASDPMAIPSTLHPPRRDNHWARRAGRWAFSTLSVAAALLLLLAWYWSNDPSRGAYAAVQRAYLDAVRLRDRQYLVTTEVRISSNHMMAIESHLTVRGSEKFTLRHPVVLGQCWIGSNGREAWFVPALGAPRTEGDPIFALEWARRQGVNLPELHVSALIGLLEEHFELELLPSEKLPQDGDIYWERVRGLRRDAQPRHLQLVELWAHPKTGVARKIVLRWDRKPQDLGLTQITLELIGEEPRPDSWYEAASHQPLPVVPLPILSIAPMANP